MKRNENRAATIDEALLSREDETVTAIARLPRAAVSASQSQAACIQTLRETAGRTQRSVSEFVRGRDGVTLKNSFWIANAVVLEVDTGRVPLAEIARIPAVERIHENVAVEALDDRRPVRAADEDEVESTSESEYTYGLEQIRVPEVWKEYETQGEGVQVAVLDTGVDPEHPDIDLYTDDPEDPTYPGGWAEFDSNGNQVEESEPYDSDGHGTHVSGTVAGGDASGTHIGVAPGIDLVHGGVLTPAGGTFSAVTGAIEWAVVAGIEVINMSLGPKDGGYIPDIIEPLQNAQAAGTLSVSACGNDGEGTSGSPANVYGAGMAVGASDESEDIASFSGGEEVITDEDWSGADDALIDDWPNKYIVPDVAAPGVAVESAVPGGEYTGANGTSMASPHVAGVAALMISTSDGPAPITLWDALEATARKPDGWDETDAEWDDGEGKDSRYGTGIIDAKAAVDQVALGSGIEGVVTDSGETPLEGVVVEADGISVTTDEHGEYAIVLPAGEYTVTADTFGFEETSYESVTVDEETVTELQIALDPELAGRVLVSPRDDIEGGESLEATVEVAHADTATVSQEGDYDESDASLAVGGESAAFDEAVGMDDGINEVEIAVATAEDTEGGVSLAVRLDDSNGFETVSTGSTTVHLELRRVGVVDASGAYDGDIADVLDSELGTGYATETPTTAAVVDNPGDYTVVVAQLLDDALVGEFIEKTDAFGIGVIYLDQWGSDSNGIPQFGGVVDVVSNTDQNDSFFGDAEVPVSYEVTAEHPIVEGIPVGSDEVIHTGDFADHTWFDLADSNGFDAIANVKHDAGDGGTALAVDDETNTVLASSLGYTADVGTAEYTAAAYEILATAVTYTADRVRDTEPALVSVTVDSLSPGETTTIDITAKYASTLRLGSLWSDWAVDAVESDGGAFTDDVQTAGHCGFGWDIAQSSVSVSVTVEPDPNTPAGEETYVGGTFALDIDASRDGLTDHVMATFEIG